MLIYSKCKFVSRLVDKVSLSVLSLYNFTSVSLLLIPINNRQTDKYWTNITQKVTDRQTEFD